MPIRKALVTGARGFIGRHLVDRLLADGAAVTVLVRHDSVLPERWRGSVQTVSSDWSEAGLRRCRPRPTAKWCFTSAAVTAIIGRGL
jgi:nucleoside-diphosphate-sugar epimerase